ncbi:tRNA (N(6)-L-threonylcarbamoyladenosine(37)-C(2))-methylthiotransferase MtaB [Effusibacillus lacus]|uniref:Threonylcarbamoyladenosine tRNA methylthiotransferase MtaB n=1 Tax=Effusibacillus lacus TaxID=1348429 RepID=A0A292YRK6_9BACL|nr:tRNA (N(6)-L-threonylcarbamoyladenosine(37)-C(2))-methylthiotransferase MtaB [Effusibacillus lacus]TCS70398.1 threonylcarbamoyladenosine tRNA methylthiotransferase MtaB [Effusibacillus lacus]GAX91549.1 tRNA (N(6)-L-threonylcarbamoyladenosine(37)-C(2))-methylthiotransferase MtaB [Effusibacillus lacus]
MSTVAFHTLGCKVNSYDTEAIWNLFRQRGYTQVDFNDIADIYVINTCTVTDTGDKKSRQMIRRAIRRNENATVVVTGCYAQMAPDEILEIPGVDLVIGTQHRDRIVDLVEKVQEEKKPLKFVSSVRSQREFEELDVPEFQGHTRAFLKIQEGCNNFCTFCIIPYSRGFIRSRKPENVILQARKLVDAGYHEIVLSGIHTGGYGDDLEGYTLADLLVDLEKVEGLSRIRISSIEASEIDDKMLQVLARSEKVCRHLHIPLQAGSNYILDRMNRKYTVEEFAAKLVELRKALPDLAVTSDVIVGFPGETDEHFAETYDFIREQQFSDLHVFPYSQRKGTPAAKYKDQVPEAVKEARVAKLIELADRLQVDYSNKYVGQVLEMIPEDINQDGLLEGFSDNYIKIAFQGHPDMLGQIVQVRLERAKADVSEGTFVKQLTLRTAVSGDSQFVDLIPLDMVKA